MNHLTSSSALSLVYDDRPLAHTVLFIGEANQLQADENSTFAMLVRTLISEGRIVHQTTVEDPTRQQVGASSVSCAKVQLRSSSPPQESFTPNETRMLSWYVAESLDPPRPSSARRTCPAHCNRA